MEAIAAVVLIGVAVYFFFQHRARRNAKIQHSISESGQPQRSTPDARDWVRPFILFYVASEMQFVPEGTLPDTVRALATGRITGSVQQSILVALQNYLSFAYGRDRQADDWPIAMREGGIFIRAELQTLNSPLALRAFVRRMHNEDTRSDISTEELDAQYATIVAKIKADDEFGLTIRNMMLKDSVEQLSATNHGMSTQVYRTRLLAHTERMLA